MKTILRFILRLRAQSERRHIRKLRRELAVELRKRRYEIRKAERKARKLHLLSLVRRTPCVLPQQTATATKSKVLNFPPASQGLAALIPPRKAA